MMWGIALGCCCVLAALHVYTRGRSSPVGALAFLLGGPVLGVLLMLYAAALNGARAGGPDSPNWGKFYGMTPADYAILMAQVGLGFAVFAAGFFSIVIASELRRRGKGWKASPRPLASAALKALGLDAFATLDDVNRAYREQAMLVHPDRGGDPAAFKRLQGNYERAKRHVKRRGPTQPSRWTLGR